MPALKTAQPQGDPRGSRRDLSVGMVERGLSGPDRVQQVTPRSPVRFDEQQENG